MLTANEIRSRFLEFFASRGHEVVKSAPLIPREDPSLLFTNAGMVQFKKAFLGQEKRDTPRAVTSQKCLRVSGKHNDLENVGRTARHHTFFEMLGNFSFGDYFKAEAIRYAWEFCTAELGLAAERLYITIYTDDDEADELWRSEAGVPPERIYRLGDKDNFWSMGDTGPCGPCSEIHYDQGAEHACGPDCGIGVCECDRYLEIWNLVFMQYDQVGPGERVNLPRPSIDTGMGLERIAAVCQGVFSNYDTDLFQRIIGFAANLADVKYKDGDEETDTALRVIADHARAAAFLIPDAVMPSNEGRGYVLRRLIRRALRFGKFLGLSDPFLFRVCEEVARAMGEAYPEMEEGISFTARVVREEEERFAKTLDKGLEILDQELGKLEKKGASEVPGETAFMLYDTYGFPIDIVLDVAEKRGFTVDQPGFEQAMQKQRERAKAAWKGSGESDASVLFKHLLETGHHNEFLGYDRLAADASTDALLDESGEPVERLLQGHGGWAVFDKTPFYGESGGQMGDRGTIDSITGDADVLDTQRPSDNLIVHKVFVNEGELIQGQKATLNVDALRRQATARNHTVTHLLHAALREVLGEHVKQAGSLVGPDRLRFDFTHISAMSPEELRDVELRVNRAILQDLPVAREIMSAADAQAKGATALFGEKYGDEVCVVEVPGVSMELCGGTHLGSTGQAGLFLVLSESGVSAGVRRIEAATGENALHQAQSMRDELTKAAAQLKSNPLDVADKVQALRGETRSLQKENERLQAKLLSGEGKSLMDDLREVNGTKVLAAKVDAPSVKVLREQMDDIRSKLPSGIACLASPQGEDKASLILYVSKDLHDRFTAPSLIKEVAALIGGSGGGRPDMAQAGGNQPEQIDAALNKLVELVEG
ncbi:alanine--tRNA ligase [Desulfohalovibrio reitneri]|uniref:alanine--tRNA ligase n=1 Tax=Desulfohalovibrio reitneri TaxID=1307759 RepID=UPI0004A6ABF7|nr:alanine--tRNA ligase [Desulfohalovibrio reitneri]